MNQYRGILPQFVTREGCSGLTFILWWSSGLWQIANRLDGAWWSVRRDDFRQRFVGDYSPVVVLVVWFENLTSRVVVVECRCDSIWKVRLRRSKCNWCLRPQGRGHFLLGEVDCVDARQDLRRLDNSEFSVRIRKTLYRMSEGTSASLFGWGFSLVM
jgi:hypothetical protein